MPAHELVTFELIDAGESGNGGWSKAQLECLGLNWPPVKGWQNRIVGKAISIQDRDKFLSLKKGEPAIYYVPPTLSSTARRITVYTDGACVPNPGEGGWAAVLLCDDLRKEISGGFRHTTNNRMELYAVIAALESLKGRPQDRQVTVYSDSQYVVYGVMRGWARCWRRNGWRRGNKTKRNKGELKNVDLWKRLLTLCEEWNAKLQWIPGHHGHEDNERCDHLAQSVIGSLASAKIDEEYEILSEQPV